MAVIATLHRPAIHSVDRSEGLGINFFFTTTYLFVVEICSSSYPPAPPPISSSADLEPLVLYKEEHYNSLGVKFLAR